MNKHDKENKYYIGKSFSGSTKSEPVPLLTIINGASGCSRKKSYEGKKETLKKKTRLLLLCYYVYEHEIKTTIHEIKTTGNADDGKN